ncbi:hypothetical protein ACS0TY_035346 [Phlomoides rotata]
MRGSGRWSGWWKDVVNLTLGEQGSRFRDTLDRVVSDGKNILFWEDVWVVGKVLIEKFPKRFHLSLDKEGRVGDIWRWEGGCWRWIWRWRRGLFDRELDTFNTLLSLVNMSYLNKGVEDSWKWRAVMKEYYCTRDAYNVLAEIRGFIAIDTEKKRVLWDRLPTKCVLCNEKDETGRHIFFECEVSYKVWMICFDWLGISTVLQSNSSSKLIAHCCIFKGKKGR